MNVSDPAGTHRCDAGVVFSDDLIWLGIDMTVERRVHTKLRESNLKAAEKLRESALRFGGYVGSSRQLLPSS